MANYTKLWSHILNSTIWNEDDHTRLVWITMLALSDMGGYVAGSIPGLAHQARVPLPACEKALITLKSPDLYSRTKDHEGRRIKEVDGGWLILNYEKHREAAAEEQRRQQNRDRAKRFRDTQRNAKSNAASVTVTQSNAPSRPSASASTSTSSSCAQTRDVFVNAGMDDDGWKTIEDKGVTPIDALILIDRSAGKKTPMGWIISHVRNGFKPATKVPLAALCRWANEKHLIESVCGIEVTGKLGNQNDHTLIVNFGTEDPRPIGASEITPENIKIRSEVK